MYLMMLHKLAFSYNEIFLKFWPGTRKTVKWQNLELHIVVSQKKNDNVSYDLPAVCGSFWKLNEADIKSRRTSISSSPSSTNGVGEAGVETIGILKTFFGGFWKLLSNFKIFFKLILNWFVYIFLLLIKWCFESKSSLTYFT